MKLLESPYTDQRMPRSSGEPKQSSLTFPYTVFLRCSGFLRTMKIDPIMADRERESERIFLLYPVQHALVELIADSCSIF